MEKLSKLNRILLYINTIKYLKFTQIIYQVRNRLLGRRKEKLRKRIMRESAEGLIPVDILIPELDFDRDYLSRYHVEDLLENKIEILHEKHLLNLTKWEVTEASHLWNYNLHYLEFLIPLAVACRNGKTNDKTYDKMYDEKYNKTEVYFKKWCEYVNMWIEYPARDSFEPYTISMRIPNLLICMNILQDKLKGTALEKKLLESIYQQYRYLLVTQERALLANHYFENLKTILVCSILFDEKNNYRRYLVKFREQVDEQILSDGLHYERSILYHKIILEDMLRVYRALKDNNNIALEFALTIKRMAVALSSISCGFQGTPLFNDAGDNVAKSTRSLLKAVQGVIGGNIADETTVFMTKGCNIPDSKKVFDAAGYYKLYAGRSDKNGRNGGNAKNALIFDCGQIGPSYMGGHAHCDCLSFELSVDGKTLFANSGTYQYQGKLRQFFRSTKAHNTIMIDEREQAELWGEHRAARRLSKIECKIENQCVTGKFQSYRGDGFLRKINLTEKNIVIMDCVHAKDKKKHEARQFFHIVPDYHYVMDNEGQASVWHGADKLADIRIPAESRGVIHKEGEICAFARDFGRLEKKEVLEIRTSFEKETKICVDIKLIEA
ncbi:MAG: heparinase II/III family protein [Clostridiales bacterium]|nr:heparinase II/III family protein [Clostridiales bacterium]